MKSTTHVWRIFLLIFIVGIAGFGAQRLLRPEGFGETGHYRVDSLFEIMDRDPVHRGKEICRECHEEILDVHEKDIHYDVKCEDCHGPGDLHVRFNLGEDDEGISEEDAVMPKEYTLEGCLFCHRKLAARPGTFPQVDPAEHYRFLHVNDPKTRCIECHSPHEPLFLLTKVSSARIHPVIHECSGCHENAPEADHREIPGHPLIFQCSDCHPAVVKDFNKQHHATLRCTACHLFHGENESAGRILKNGNRGFCLLCHEQKPFKDGDGPPLIVPMEHLLEEADITEEDELAKNPMVCLECHLDDIHDSDLLASLGESSDE